MSAWFKHNWHLKLISLILAVGTWFYAVSEESVEVTREIPLAVNIENEHMTISAISTRILSVTLSAPRSLIANLASQDIRAIHKLGSEVKNSGEYSFRVEPSEIKLPSFQIGVVRIDPEIVTVKLDEVISQKLEVQGNFAGEPAIGYKLLTDEIKMDPNAIMVQGSKNILEQMTVLKTAPIDLVGRIRSLHRTVEVELPQGVKALSETLIDVYIPIREEFDEKEFQDVPVKTIRSSSTIGVIDLSPDKVTFVLKGSKLALEKLTSEQILAYVDVSDLKKGDYDLPLQIVLPETLSLKSKDSILIKVAIRALTE